MPLTPLFKLGAVQLRCNAVQRMQRYLLHTSLLSAITSHQQRHWRCEGSFGLSKLQSMDTDRCPQNAGDAGSHSRSAQPQAQNLWIPTPTSGLRRSVKLRAYVLREALVWAPFANISTIPEGKPIDCARLCATLLQISFGKILTPLGVGMLTYGFGSFFNLLPGGDVSSLLLIYGVAQCKLICRNACAETTPVNGQCIGAVNAGFVISLLGFALAYAQLVPVPCKTTRQAYDLREAQATDIQKQVLLH